MIGNLDPNHDTVHIIGGGAAGLFAAYQLSKNTKNKKIVIYEKSGRLGGLLNSVQNEYALIESAANTLVDSENLRELCDDIGVRIHPSQASRKYILKKGRLRKFPLSLFGFLRLLWGLFFIKNQKSEYTFKEWGETFFGREASEYLIQPMCRGIYAVDASKIDVALAFPSFLPKIRQTLFSKLRESKEKRRVVAAEGGMAEFCSKIHAYLEIQMNVEVRLNTCVDVLPYNSLVCTPAYITQKLMSQIKEDLNAVSYTSLCSVGVVIAKKDLRRVPFGLGCLIPPLENRKIMGILYSSSMFPSRVMSEDDILLTVLTGDFENTNESVLTELKDLFGLKGEPKCLVTHKWDNAIPIYSKSLREMITNLQTSLPKGVALFGNYTGAVSLRGMLDESRSLRNL